MKSIDAKVVVLGAQGVGKTSLVLRYINHSFNHHVSPTIGASFFTCKVTLDSYRIKLQVWDTAGQERFRSMAPMYYRKANVALLVYDITSLDSFEDLKTWITELHKNVDEALVICVLGNKCDMSGERQVTVEEAEEYAGSMGALHFETSALSGTGIEEVFIYMAQELVRQVEMHYDTDNGPFGEISTDNSSMSKHENGIAVQNPEGAGRTCCSA